MLILAGYLYVDCPAFAQLVPGTVELNLASHSWSGIFPWTFVLMPIVVTLAALFAAVAEFRAGSFVVARGRSTGHRVRRRHGWLRSEAKYAASPWWLLSLDRSAAITGGVSAHVPAAFLMAALGAWLYARRRIATINEAFAFATAHDLSAASTPERNRSILMRIDVHRARFDRWFVAPEDFFRLFRGTKMSWPDVWPVLIAIAFLFGTFFDTVVFRPISASDEGLLFDLCFRVAFGLLLTLLAANFARLHLAWRDFRAVLDGFAKILGSAFERIPKNVSNWLMSTESCDAEYRSLISRQFERHPKTGHRVGLEDRVAPNAGGLGHRGIAASSFDPRAALR